MLLIPVDRSEVTIFRQMLVEYWRDLVPGAKILGDLILAEVTFEQRYRWTGASNNPYWAVSQKRKVGFLMYRVFDDGSTAYIHDFFVVPGFRRQGYGSEMLGLLGKHLSKKGVRQLELGVLAKNRGAYSFWEKQGFELQSYRLGRSLESS
jgi:ribosomal protein S18 acetylase RimI-like enzyme